MVAGCHAGACKPRVVSGCQRTTCAAAALAAFADAHRIHIVAKAKPKTKAGKKRKVSKVMREFKAGKLRSGSKTGPKVTNPKQAVAIAMSESGQSKPKSKAKRKSSGRSRRKSR